MQRTQPTVETLGVSNKGARKIVQKALEQIEEILADTSIHNTLGNLMRSKKDAFQSIRKFFDTYQDVEEAVPAVDRELYSSFDQLLYFFQTKLIKHQHSWKVATPLFTVLTYLTSILFVDPAIRSQN